MTIFPQNFALQATKLCTKICILILCEHALISFKATPHKVLTLCGVVFIFLFGTRPHGNCTHIFGICRTCSHRNWHASFRQILPMTALKFLDLRQQACEVLPCPRQNLHEYPRTNSYADRFLLYKIPNIPCIIHNGTVGGKYPCACNIHKGHFVPAQNILILFGSGKLCFAVTVKVGKGHILIGEFQ